MDSIKYVQGIFFFGNMDIHAYVEYVTNKITCIDTNLETGCDILCFRGGVGSYCGKKKTPHDLRGWYQCSERIYYLHLIGRRRNIFLRGVGTQLPDYAISKQDDHNTELPSFVVDVIYL